MLSLICQAKIAFIFISQKLLVTYVIYTMREYEQVPLRTCDKFYFKKQFLQLHGAFTKAECGWSAH